MRYVEKDCIRIDISHRYADKLATYFDFLCVSIQIKNVNRLCNRKRQDYKEYYRL